ncbi:hypothetical protein HELRODRAFT_111355 [Helobdella robusta]|uniref:Peptidase S54 rhomboid domain-containing protein n=1 Tax=Helobdella robusta TaxID=6412 RepID=T1EFA5_HELRO|nr:hypothetical protein HELRODRAFT_111355 [Helobdella robusta]ESO04883.1 hypothetical protein HELRODRAFT_111355 [Helobdella robusta]
MPDDVINNLPDNGKRQFAIGIVGEFLGTNYKESGITRETLDQLEEMQDYRPFFTYWATFVQIIIFIIATSVYGFSPLGFSETPIFAEVRTVSLAIEKVFYNEKNNMWIGPKQADLIHLGAKYSPCMRRDANVVDRLNMDIEEEEETGCCSYNDGSGCVQLSSLRCPKTLASWYNNTVCGLDPDYCSSASVLPTMWPKNNITEWPICQEVPLIPPNGPKHMTCEVVARPCCVGIHGQCIITTPAYCAFRGGYFHPEANLCSQVKSCLSEICGMLPFYNETYPNQFYRLWTSLFLHAGILQLLITIIFQYFIMRDIERLLGWFRVCVIYIASGIAGSLASAIFLPYHVEAGPSGSQFGLLASLFVEVIYGWQLGIVQSPCLVIFKLTSILIFLFIIGLFPWVDNYAHLFGFIFGFFISFALMPYAAELKILGRRGQILCMAACSVVVLVMFLVLFILFYVSPIYSCDYCQYFNCIPFTQYFCKSMEVKVHDSREL